LMRVEDRANLLRRGASTEWAVEDSGVDGSNPSSTEVDPEGWTIELRCPAPLTIPAQLDLDPGSSLRPEPAWSPEKSPSVLTLYRPNS
ncbi:MAG TPA: hypothetical protein VFT74_07975, partial [Isosphaeraceae bacterium]|nr:hypothetical protein [Isosphaeraceae bacterium]